MLIVGFEVRGHDFPVLIEQMLEEIMANDCNKSGVIVIQLLEIRFFNSVDDLILECLVNCSHIFVDSPSFFVLKLELVSVVLGGIWWHRMVYFRVGWVGTLHVREGGVEHWIHYDANVPVVFSYIRCQKGRRVGVYELHNFVNALISGISFDRGERLDGELGRDLVNYLRLA